MDNNNDTQKPSNSVSAERNDNNATGPQQAQSLAGADRLANVTRQTAGGQASTPAQAVQHTAATQSKPVQPTTENQAGQGASQRLAERKPDAARTEHETSRPSGVPQSSPGVKAAPDSQASSNDQQQRAAQSQRVEAGTTEPTKSQQTVASNTSQQEKTSATSKPPVPGQKDLPSEAKASEATTTATSVSTPKKSTGEFEEPNSSQNNINKYTHIEGGHSSEYQKAQASAAKEAGPEQQRPATSSDVDKRPDSTKSKQTQSLCQLPGPPDRQKALPDDELPHYALWKSQLAKAAKDLARSAFFLVGKDPECSPDEMVYLTAVIFEDICKYNRSWMNNHCKRFTTTPNPNKNPTKKGGIKKVRKVADPEEK
ncbi:hypothetical protein [Cerasicoccus fimbriatus]|uniref:hypothetical protein n=1 Tax=Cerasicoccus fimbriatus TaxID=3014554 RepID=UPI0022B2CDA5|nr:hypothetical protein [Cerasicoccus sp. TK19100]